MAGLHELGVQLLRIGAGDTWSSKIQYSAWKNNPTRFYQALDAYADAALEHGLQLVITCLGFADGSYDKDRVTLYDASSQDFADACAFVGDVARHFAGHRGVYCIEFANEPDHDYYAFNHWLPKYPDYATRLAKFGAWVKAAVDLSGQLAGEGHAVITMGHALIGAMFCVETYHWSESDGRYIADTWNYARNGKDYLKIPNDPCPVPSIHAYSFGAPVSDFTNDWITPFAAYCKGRAVTGLVGEHGDLRTAAAWYLKDLEDAMSLAGLYSCAMRLAPRDGFPLTSEPVVTSSTIDTPAPDETPVEDPTSSEIEPPAQETPETTEEPVIETPGEATEPGQEEPPEVVVEEPPVVEPTESEISDPPVTELVTEDPEDPVVESPTTPSSPTPGTGRNVLVELARRIAEILSRLFKRK